MNSCTDESLCDVDPAGRGKGFGVVGRGGEDATTAADDERRLRSEATVP